MTLPLPNLDDRTFGQLVEEARQRIATSCPEWSDLSVHDPGVTLLEAFAFLTETMLYRLNRLPEKAYIAFLNLIGVRLQPPAAASAGLEFSRLRAGGGAVTIPAGTRVTVVGAAGGAAPVFLTAERAVLAEDEDTVRVVAHHCESVEGEELGLGTGLPGLALQVARPPIAVTSEPVDVLLGVEARAGEVTEGAVAREFGGKTFEIWEPVPAFAGFGADDQVYVLDRSTGKVTFGPSVTGVRPGSEPVPLAAVPQNGREIRIWYRTGGGPAGNVAANTLTSLKDGVAGVRVTNPEPAQGGRPIELLDNAVQRGPQEFFSLRRAVTATDFERLAVATSGAVARAKALTRADVWSFARPGEVEVLLVPYVPDSARPGGRLPVDALVGHEVEDVRARTQADLDGRRPLGINCITAWARYKAVSINARVVVRREEDAEAVRQRVLDRLYQTISPLPTPVSPTGWPFGEALRASNVYRMLEQAEPGVRYVDEVRFTVDEAPDGEVRSVAADQYQPNTWYAASGPVLYRSTNNGVGWEPAGRFPDEEVRVVAPYPGQARPGVVPRPGHLAVVTRKPEAGGSSVYVSTDLGERWQKVAELQAGVADVAWLDRAQVPILLLATDVGLYELSLMSDAVPLQVLVDASDPDRGFYKVVTFTSERGVPCVALAAQAQFGIYLSTEGGAPQTFSNVGLAGVDTRTLTVQIDGPATYLWAGAGEPDPNRPGTGCSRARLFEADVRWTPQTEGWGGGTCWSLAFAGSTVLAGTQSGGVLRLDLASPQPAWQPPDVNCGLPLRDRPRFEPVNAVATDPDGDLLIVGGLRGVYRSRDGGVRYQSTANRESTDVVTVPETWILVSGTHEIEVVTGDAARRD
ncbi:MAG: putative baseplate assembly protein [Acidimicrobiales bacterium]